MLQYVGVEESKMNDTTDIGSRGADSPAPRVALREWRESDAAALFALAEMKNDTCRYGKAAWR